MEIFKENFACFTIIFQHFLPLLALVRKQVIVKLVKIVGKINFLYVYRDVMFIVFFYSDDLFIIVKQGLTNFFMRGPNLRSIL